MNGKELEKRCQRLENALDYAIRSAQRILNRPLETRESIAILKSITELGRVVSSEQEPPIGTGYEYWDAEPALMGNEEICERFVSAYKLQSNPRIHNYLKSGHDEILRRLRHRDS